MKRVRMPRKKETSLGKCIILNQNDALKKRIELQIAKKMHEVEVLKIELKYPEVKKNDDKIGFKV